jgi:hypothetical protein
MKVVLRVIVTCLLRGFDGDEGNVIVLHLALERFVNLVCEALWHVADRVARTGREEALNASCSELPTVG